MKIVAILLVSLTAITAAPFENVDLVNVRPIEEMPGFWDGRESLKSLIVNTKESSRITNGDEAYPGQFPYMGFILMNLLHGGSFFCGCSLISASRALTAVS